MMVHNIWDLTDDGDEFELPDGRVLRLEKLSEDESCLYGKPFMTLDDDEYLGQFAWVQYDRHTGNSIRPSGFDGRARISGFDGRARISGFDGRARILRRQGGNIWWQPGPEMTDDQIADMLPKIRDLLDEGYRAVRLELLDAETDAYGRRIVREFGYAGHIWPHETDLRDHISYCIEQMESGDQFPPLYRPEEMVGSA